MTDQFHSYGVDAIDKARTRQVIEKGYTPEHDDQHDPADLVAAGLAYTQYTFGILANVDYDTPPYDWPWDPEEWSPEDDPKKNLAKAGALLAAGFDAIVRRELASGA